MTSPRHWRFLWSIPLATIAVAQVSNLDPVDSLPPAEELMQRVRDTFALEPWRVRADLVCRDADDVIRRAYGVELSLDGAARPPQAVLVLRDAFGGDIATLRVSRPPGQPPKMMLMEARGKSMREIDPGELAVDTNLTWSDLILDFLWWEGGRTRGYEIKKGRECHLVEIPGPAGARYTRIRLWLDVRESALLHAEAYVDRRLVRRLSVKSLQKVGGRWTIQDIEIESPEEGTRATLRVRDSAPQLPPSADPKSP